KCLAAVCRIVCDGENRTCKHGVFGRGKWRRKRNPLADVRITKRARRRGQTELRTKGIHIDEAVVEYTALQSVVKHSKAAANTGFAITGGIKGKSDARSYIVVAAFDAPARYARIARKQQASRSVGVDLRANV